MTDCLRIVFGLTKAIRPKAAIMRSILFLPSLFAICLTLGGEPVVAASFDCSGQKSVAETFICETPDLSSADDQLAILYRDTRNLVKTWPDRYPGRESPSAWFKKDSRAAWKWREANCKDLECMTDWFDRRLALMRWMTSSGERLGAHGLLNLVNLPGRTVLISFEAETEIRNVALREGREKFQDLPNGRTELSFDPAGIRIFEHRGAFLDGQGYSVDMLVSDAGKIVEIGVPLLDHCYSRDEFISITPYEVGHLAAVQSEDICVTLTQ